MVSMKKNRPQMDLETMRPFHPAPNRPSQVAVDAEVIFLAILEHGGEITDVKALAAELGMEEARFYAGLTKAAERGFLEIMIEEP